MAASTSCLIVSGTDLGIPQVELAKNTGIPGNTMPGTVLDKDSNVIKHEGPDNGGEWVILKELEL